MDETYHHLALRKLMIDASGRPTLGPRGLIDEAYNSLVTKS